MNAVWAVLVSAALYSAAFPPFGIDWLLWVALVPLLGALGRLGAGQAVLLGGGFGFSIAVFIVSWIGPTLVGYYERPLLFAGGLLALLWLTMGAPYYAAALGALAFVRPHLGRTAWLLLVPTAWVAAEWTRSELGLRAAWALGGDAFHGWPRLRQVADVTGVYGVTFVVVLGNVALCEGLRAARGRAVSRSFLVVAAAFGVLLCGVLGYGEMRLRQFTPRDDAPGLDVLMVQGNVEPSLRWQRTGAARTLRRYGSLTRDALYAAPPPDLILWPENAVQTGIEDPTYGPPLWELVRRFDVPLLLGAPRSERSKDGVFHYNSAFLLSPGAAPDHYDKRHLMPFGESNPFGELFDTGQRGDLDTGRWRPGERPGVMAVGGHLLGVFICLEGLYPETARDAVASGAAMLVNLSNDGWFQGRGGPEQHFGQVVFRAIEVRRPLLRVTTTGVSGLVAADGTVSHSLGFGERGALRATVHPITDGVTFYARFGNLFAGACTAALTMAVALATLRRQQLRRTGSRAQTRHPSR